MKKSQILMNKPVFYKILINDFCYDYVKPKYGEKTKLRYMDTDIYIEDNRYIHYIHKNRWYLWGHCRRC